MNNSINQDNWTFTHYALADMKAKICLGGDLENEEYQELYFVSLLDAENQELSQTTHKSLEDAIKAINGQHQGWDFVDEMIKPSGSGCSTCVAH
jgi:hypothetical protein